MKVIPNEARCSMQANDLALQIPIKCLFWVGAELAQQDEGTFTPMLDVRHDLGFQFVSEMC